jgi:hypothetical protein
VNASDPKKDVYSSRVQAALTSHAAMLVSEFMLHDPVKQPCLLERDMSRHR